MDWNCFNLCFEEFMASVIWENGLGNILGRDVLVFIDGFSVCLVLWALFDGKKVGK